jgi:hypothetical protein
MTAPSHNKQHNPDECEKKFITYPKVLAWGIGLLSAGFITAYGFGVYSTDIKRDVKDIRLTVTSQEPRISALEKSNQEQFNTVIAKLDTLNRNISKVR